MQDEHDYVANRLKKRRIELKLSLQELSNLTGLSKSTLQRYETGNTDKIPLSKLRILSSALQVTGMHLLGFESLNLPLSYFQSIKKLFNELGYDIEYNEEKETYMIVSENGINYMICDNDLKNLKDSISSFTKFKIIEFINKTEDN